MSRTAPLNEANRACEPIGQSSLAINGQEQTVKNIDFTTNSIHSKFTDSPPVTQAASGLPQMQGSGLVRGFKIARIAAKSIACCAVSARVGGQKACEATARNAYIYQASYP